MPQGIPHKDASTNLTVAAHGASVCSFMVVGAPYFGESSARATIEFGFWTFSFVMKFVTRIRQKFVTLIVHGVTVHGVTRGVTH